MLLIKTKRASINHQKGQERRYRQWWGWWWLFFWFVPFLHFKNPLKWRNYLPFWEHLQACWLERVGIILFHSGFTYVVPWYLSRGFHQRDVKCFINKFLLLPLSPSPPLPESLGTKEVARDGQGHKCGQVYVWWWFPVCRHSCVWQ